MMRNMWDVPEMTSVAARGNVRGFVDGWRSEYNWEMKAWFVSTYSRIRFVTVLVKTTVIKYNFICGLEAWLHFQYYLWRCGVKSVWFSTFKTSRFAGKYFYLNWKPKLTYRQFSGQYRGLEWFEVTERPACISNQDFR
jgi:hypothetical protein